MDRLLQINTCTQTPDTHPPVSFLISLGFPPPHTQTHTSGGCTPCGQRCWSISLRGPQRHVIAGGASTDLDQLDLEKQGAYARHDPAKVNTPPHLTGNLVKVSKCCIKELCLFKKNPRVESCYQKEGQDVLHVLM